MPTIDEYAQEATRRPEDYFGTIDDLMDEGFSGGMFGKSRDSEILEISNYETAKEVLSKWIARSGWDTNDHYDGAVSVQTSNHWAVGWVETIHVKIRNRHGKYTKAFRVAVAMLQRMEDYPVLDDFDYSKRENEDLWEYVDGEVDDAENCIRWLFDEHSVSRSDDVRYEWIKEWKEANEPNDD